MKKAKEFIVYCSYINEGKKDSKFYIGFWSSNNKIKFENYFGSSTFVKAQNVKNLSKELIVKSSSKAGAKMVEAWLQLKFMSDPRCLNGIVNCRLPITNTTKLTKFPKRWKPKI